MSLICLASAKGAPGVTLTSLALAAAWPASERGKVLLEADQSGGSLAVRYQLGRQPGLVTLAAAGGHGLGRNDLWSHVQAMPGGLGVIVAPERGDRASTILATTGPQLGSWLAQLDDLVVIADCGRVSPCDASTGLASKADQIFVLARSAAEEIQPAAVLANSFAAAGLETRWVLIGDKPHGPDEVEAATGIEVARVLPDDRRGAEAILAGQGAGRRQSSLVRAIATWANDLSRQRPAEEPITAVVAEPHSVMAPEAAR